MKNSLDARTLALAMLVGALGSAAAAQETRPNILFILADDVGQDVLGSYGGESYPTPHLDELARTGTRFRYAFSLPTCHPTRLTLMTGRYPFRHGHVPWGSFPKSEEAWTFSSLLQKEGYATAVAGKWQLTLLRDDPMHAHRLGFLHSDLFGWHEGPRYYEPMIYRNGTVRDDTLGHYGPDLYVRSLIDFMAANRARPFLAYYSMALCHDVTDDLESPVPHGPFGRYDSYPEMVMEMDRSVGRLVAALNALELREKTLVMFVGDNGTPRRMIVRAEGQELIKVPVVSRQNGRDVPGGKGLLTDGGTRVPLIANWPGTVAPDRVVDDLVDMSDFLPTFLDLAGVAVPQGRNLDGRSLVPLLKGQGPTGRTWAYAQESVLPKPGGVEPEGPGAGLKWVRTARFKLYNDGRLFDLSTDPGEESPIRQDTSADQRGARAGLEAAFEDLGLVVSR